MLLPLLGFVFASLLVAAVGLHVSSRGAAVVERRLGEVVWTAVLVPDEEPRRDTAMKLLKRVGSKVPRSPAEMGKLRLRLVQAWFRGSEALAVFFGIRVTVAVGVFLLLATPVVMHPNLMLAIGAFGLGYVLPGIALARLAKRRQHRIRLGLADALDLLVVSVEAGL